MSELFQIINFSIGVILLSVMLVFGTSGFLASRRTDLDRDACFILSLISYVFLAFSSFFFFLAVGGLAI